MKEKYYKVKKEIAERAGLDSRLREVVDEEYLLLSEKDIKMISLTLEERLHAIGACPLCETEEEIEEDLPQEEEENQPEGDIDDDGEEKESDPEEEVEPITTEEDEH